MATDKLINSTQGDDIIDALNDIADNVGNITYGPQTSSDKVVSMLGYAEAAEAASINPGDTLNQAIGKLEKRIDNDETALAGKQATLTTEQLAAVNSGIDSTKVGQIATNTTDISSLQDTVGNKVDKVAGKDLSSNDYSDTEKSKLAGIEAGAEVNVQADWNQTTSTDDSYIKNKPTLGTAAAADTTDFATAAQGTKADNAIPSSSKGVANGVAELDSNGKVPSAQLPSYVDDVLEYSAKSSFPATGETGKIYVDTSDNKTYRWGGSAYVEISESLALGDTSSTAYYGDRGKAAYDHSQTTSGNPHNVTKSDVGLGNVGNFKAVSTVASQGLSDTEKSNARANIGAGTSSLTVGTGASNAAAGNHTHGLSLATDSGTSSISLAANTKYKLTAGGSTYVFTTPPDNNTTYGVVSTSANGLAPKVTDTSKFLKGDGTWATPANTWTAMVGATSSANGSVGYVNATPPKDGYNTKYLRADGTWQVPPNTTYSAATTSAAGLMSAADKTKLNGIATGAQVNSITGVKGNSESTYRTGNVNLTAANIGAVPNTAAGVSAAINQLTTGDSAPTDNDYYVSQYAGGGTSTTTYHRRPVSKLWDYIKSKFSLSTTGSGNAVTGVSYSNGAFTVTKGSSFAASSHTHNYAGSSSAGGSAFTADKLKLKSVRAQAPVKGWTRKTWSGLTSFYGNEVWTDGTNIYYSDNGANYVLNGSTWTKKTWSGMTSFYGDSIWTDGTNIYFSSGSTQRVLNGSTWSTKTWSGLTNFNRQGIWTDGTDIYHSYYTDHYVLNRASSTWTKKTWSGLTSFMGDNVWTDGTNIYYSEYDTQYVLNGSTWSTKTWSGLSNFYGSNLWTDGDNIYCADGSTHHVLADKKSVR